MANIYQLLQDILPADGIGQDHAATIDADIRDSYIYIRINGVTISINELGEARKLDPRNY